MKIIYRLDTNDVNIIKNFSQKVFENEIVLPNEGIRIYVISDKGEVTELE